MIKHYPIITPHNSDDLWTLDETFEIEIPGVGLMRIMKGFVCDFGSIPKCAWFLVGHPLTIICMVAYLIHDALYSSKLLTRKQADKILFKLLRMYGAGIVRSSAIYSAVRLGGRLAWTHRKASSAKAARRYVKLHPFMPVA
jgi:hypothetical protein